MQALLREIDLVAGSDLDEQLNPQEYSEWVRKTQDSLRVLAELYELAPLLGLAGEARS